VIADDQLGFGKRLTSGASADAIRMRRPPSQAALGSCRLPITSRLPSTMKALDSVAYTQIGTSGGGAPKSIPDRYNIRPSAAFAPPTDTTSRAQTGMPAIIRCGSSIPR
jgi:hypothetical protein